MANSKKYEHGYLPKIQYHSTKVVEITQSLMIPELPEALKNRQYQALNKSLDSIIHFTTKLREQYGIKD